MVKRKGVREEEEEATGETGEREKKRRNLRQTFPTSISISGWSMSGKGVYERPKYEQHPFFSHYFRIPRVISHAFSQNDLVPYLELRTRIFRLFLLNLEHHFTYIHRQIYFSTSNLNLAEE